MRDTTYVKQTDDIFKKYIFKKQENKKNPNPSS